MIKSKAFYSLFLFIYILVVGVLAFGIFIPKGKSTH